MKPVHRSAMVTFVGLLGVGCMQETPPTVEYFRSHPEERVAQIARCANDPGSLKDSPACVNAQQAADLERHDSLRNLPSMGLQETIPPSPAEETGPRQAQ